MAKQTYELDDVADEDIIDLKPVEIEDSDTPDHRMAERRVALIHYVLKGAKPDRVARVLGLENWRDDPYLSKMVPRAEDAFICEMEIKAANEIRATGKLTAGIKFLFESRAEDYVKKSKDDDDKEKPPTSYNVKRVVVPGREHKEDLEAQDAA